MQLNVRIRERIATYLPTEGDDLYVCGNGGDTIAFDFDNEWVGKDPKTARFISAGEHTDVEFTGSVCEIPVFKDSTSFTVGVYVGEPEKDANDNIAASTGTIVPCRISIRYPDSVPSGSTGKNYTNEARGYAEEAKASAAIAKASEEATAGMGAEVQAHQAYYDSMAHQVEMGVYGENAVLVVAEGEKDTVAGIGTHKCVVLPNGFETVSANAFARSSVELIRLPPSLRGIAISAFEMCQLRKMNIPRNVETIGDYAFAECNMLTSVEFASNGKLQRIGTCAFDNTKISPVVIPKSVTWIGSGAFRVSVEQTVIIDLTDYGNETPFPNIGGLIYNDNTSSCTVYVPNGRKAELLSMTNWASGDYNVVEREV